MPTKEEIQKFSSMIENLSEELNGTMIDTISHYSEKTGVEMTHISTLLSSAIKSKILDEAQQLNMVKRSSKLPI